MLEDDAMTAAVHVEVDRVGIGEQARFEVAQPQTDKHTGASAVQRLHVLAGVLQRIPSSFEQ
jgi:hypothetical protein